MVKVAVPFVYIQAKKSNKEKGAFEFTLKLLSNLLNGHMPKHCCMLRLAERTGMAVFGVKGLSPLLRALDVPSKVLLDYMHPVVAGEFLGRLHIWLESQSDCGFLANKKQ